jgi:hypothetical protein
MAEVIRPRDTLIVGWENEFAGEVEAERRHYVRARQVERRLLQASTQDQRIAAAQHSRCGRHIVAARCPERLPSEGPRKGRSWQGSAAVPRVTWVLLPAAARSLSCRLRRCRSRVAVKAARRLSVPAGAAVGVCGRTRAPGAAGDLRPHRAALALALFEQHQLRHAGAHGAGRLDGHGAQARDAPPALKGEAQPPAVAVPKSNPPPLNRAAFDAMMYSGPLGVAPSADGGAACLNGAEDWMSQVRSFVFRDPPWFLAPPNARSWPDHRSRGLPCPRRRTTRGT